MKKIFRILTPFESDVTKYALHIFIALPNFLLVRAPANRRYHYYELLTADANITQITVIKQLMPTSSSVQTYTIIQEVMFLQSI